MLIGFVYLSLRALIKLIRVPKMIVFNLVGLLLIGFIIWWFWLYKPCKATDVNKEDIIILVENGIYQPSRIKIPSGVKVILKFLRKDSSTCASTVLFPHVEVNQELPLGAITSVSLPPMNRGVYEFQCPMKMYLGSLVVE